MAAKTKKIDCYVDCVSPFSYFAELYIFKNRKALESQGVDVEFHPIFLGGVMQASGNKPPATLPARAKYYEFDRTRGMKFFDAPDMRRPCKFPQNTLPAMRALCYAKANHPRERFEAALVECSRVVWEREEDVSQPEVLRRALGRVFGDERELEAVLGAGTQPAWKEKLNANTKVVIDCGGYGAPWFLVTNGEGTTESFFGSDRWHYMWAFLGLEFEELRLVERAAARM